MENYILEAVAAKEQLKQEIEPKLVDGRIPLVDVIDDKEFLARLKKEFGIYMFSGRCKTCGKDIVVDETGECMQCIMKAKDLNSSVS